MRTCTCVCRREDNSAPHTHRPTHPRASSTSECRHTHVCKCSSKPVKIALSFLLCRPYIQRFVLACYVVVQRSSIFALERGGGERKGVGQRTYKTRAVYRYLWQRGFWGMLIQRFHFAPPLSAASTGGDGELHHRSTTQEMLSANDEKKKGANGNESGTARI